MMPMRLAVITLALGFSGLAGCTQAPPEAVDEPTEVAEVEEQVEATEVPPTVAVVEVGDAALYVASEPVSFIETADAEPMVLYGGETVTPTVGAEILVGETGVGLLGWEGFLRAELMSDATATIDEFDADALTISMTQQPGTARYTLPKNVDTANIRISAGPIGVSFGEGSSDVIVSHQPADGAEPIVWVIAMNGGVDIDAVDAQGQSAVLESPQVVAYVPGKGFTDVMSVEPVTVEVWYGALTAGRVKPITLAAFRCEVISESADVMPEPEDGDGAPLATLLQGHVVDALGRDEQGLWVQVAGYGIVGNAWLQAEALKCIFPVGELALSDVLLAEAEDDVTPTLVATKAVAAVSTETPTPGPTEDTRDQGGDDGSGSSGGSSPTDVPPTEQPVGPPTETECVGPECTAPAGPPTMTRRPPRPTKKPPTDPPPPEPTKEPPPEPTKEPPPEPTKEPPPEPTEPPPPEPTDPPAPEPTEGS